MIVLAIAVFVLVAFVVYRDILWEQRLNKVELAAAAEREAATKERRELYQRIQAPELAVAEAHAEARRERPYVRRKPIGADDDAAFRAQREEAEADRG